jgi:hypothetical protein
MTPSKKPEWFEISENDKSSDVRGVTKRYPLLALLVTALILGVGAVVAQTQEEQPASAVQSVTPTPSVVTPKIPESKSLTTKSPSVQTPSIKKPPAIRDNEDDDDEEGHERGERRERGEHRDFGDDD